MTVVQAGTDTAVLPAPRPAADDRVAGSARPAPDSRAGAYQRVLHQAVRRELRLLGDLLSWAPAAEAARTRTLTGHADLLGRLLLAHHRLERDALWPALLDVVPDERVPALRSAIADWAVRSARIDAQVRDLATAARQWAVTGTPAARDALALACRRLADAVDAATAVEERDLVPLLDAHLDAERWAAVAAASSCRLTGRERQLVLGLALEDCCSGDRARVIGGLPRRRRLAWRLVGLRRYRAAVVRLRGAPPAR
jgi:hypothetical protein